MRGLLDFATRQDVQDIVGRFTSEPAVHGVILEYKPLWLIARSATDDQWSAWLRGPWPFPEILSSFPWSVTSQIAPSLGQTDRVVWDRWQKHGRGEPKRLRVCVRPDRMADFEPPSDLPPDGPIAVVYEERPLARLTRERGLRATAGRSEGTVGGVIESIHGEWLGVTCSHVARGGPTIEIHEEGPSPLRRFFGGSKRSAATKVERVRRTELRANRPGDTCNPYGIVDHSNELDVALLKGDFEHAEITKCKGRPAARVSASSGQAIKMHAVDGGRTAQVGGLALYYTLVDDLASYCFRGLFEVLAPPYSPKIVHPGDSGAWIMRHGQHGDEWFGMVLASDDLRGFAMFAEPIIDWVRLQGL